MYGIKEEGVMRKLKAIKWLLTITFPIWVVPAFVLLIFYMIGSTFFETFYRVYKEWKKWMDEE